jgi:predicted nucleic acid-binding Zn finger protein
MSRMDLEKKLIRIFSNIKRRKIFTLDDYLDLYSIVKDVGLQTLEALEDNRAFKLFFGRRYRVAFFVGNRDNYIQIPETFYCGCMSKYPANLQLREICYHIITYRILEALGKLVYLYLEEKDFNIIIDELIYHRLEADDEVMIDNEY